MRRRPGAMGVRVVLLLTRLRSATRVARDRGSRSYDSGRRRLRGVALPIKLVINLQRPVLGLHITRLGHRTSMFPRCARQRGRPAARRPPPTGRPHPRPSRLLRRPSATGRSSSPAERGDGCSLKWSFCSGRTAGV